MVDKSDVKLQVEADLSGTQNESPQAEDRPKKKFVKPEISVPVDVLEATTFFQAADSGPTNP